MKLNKKIQELGNEILKHKGTGYDQVLLREVSGQERVFYTYLLSAQRQKFIEQNSTTENIGERLKTVQKEDFVEFSKLTENGKE